MQNTPLHTRLVELEKKWLNGSITPQEATEYMEWYNRENKEDVYIPEVLGEDEFDHRERLFRTVQSKMAKDESPNKKSIFHMFPNHFMRYAAALILIIGSGAYLWTTKKSSGQITKNTLADKETIKPGKDVALLTLADGTTILLDSVHEGILAREGNMEIVKLANGKITYDLKDGPKGIAVMNTMSTPKGGKYQLRLPDGSTIWLNSASSIKYPTFFNDNERKVFITGEVYIDVAKDKSKPFIVDVNGKTSIEVLGTQFNVNSYNDESSVRTTLVEGSIKVKHATKNFILKPGQQLDGINFIDHPNIEQALAWKNGYLNFDNSNIQTAMRQIARWYNIEIVYEGKVPTDLLMGKLPMDASIEQVLKVLKNIGIQFKIEGNKLIVSK